MRHILLIYLLLPCLACAETSLWRVIKGNNQLYIGGTMHLLSKSDYPLPDEYEQAFREIDTLVLEANLDELSSPKARARLKQSLLYAEGSTIKSAITPKIYMMLMRYCETSSLSFNSIQAMKPAMVVLTLTLTELKRLGLADAGVDKFFLDKAKAKGKKITGLESAETQLNALENMGKGYENELILSTIKELKRTPEFIDEMKKAWRVGNLAELDKIGIKKMRSEFPELNQTLLATRNDAWLPKIMAMLETKDRELILVGVLHLAGDDGVLSQLKKQGLVVEQY